ncbi:hypothetical protein AeMF1_016598 [Aphanomyces euteiches]|nr:hypothetical protein AeMF1_016598 [Aphanomyces euteiches]
MDRHIGYTRPSLTEHVRSTAMDTHIGYTRPSLTEHVRSTAMDRHIGYIRSSLTEHVRSTTMDRHIEYTRPSLTEHVRSTVDRHIEYTRPSLTEHVRSTTMECNRQVSSLTHIRGFRLLDTFNENEDTYSKIEPPFGHEHACEWCGAILWKHERLKRQTPCCSNGKIKIPTLTWEDMFDNQVSRGQYTNDNPCTRGEFMAQVNEYKRMFRDTAFAENSRK